MSTIAWISVCTVAVVMLVMALWMRWRRRKSVPLTAEEHLHAARVAARAIRRDMAKSRPDDLLHAPLHISDSAATSDGP